MSRRDVRHSQAGFTLPELVLVLVVVTIMSAALLTFVSSSLRNYFSLEQGGASFSELAMQSQRVASAIRGLTDITEASSDDLTIYAYFEPSDTYVSLVHYYKNAAGTELFADVTPMTANPPTGQPIPSQKKTFTIIDNLAVNPSVHLFTYLDSSFSPMAMPISDLHIVKAIQINLAVPGIAPGSSASDALSLQVSLRNRKTNL